MNKLDAVLIPALAASLAGGGYADDIRGQPAPHARPVPKKNSVKRAARKRAQASRRRNRGG